MADYLDDLSELDTEGAGEFAAVPPIDPRDIGTDPRADQLPLPGVAAWREGGLPVFVPASLPRRAVAGVIDAAAVSGLISVAVAVSGGASWWSPHRPVATIGSVVAGFVTWRAVGLAKWGATPGLTITDLGVVTHGYPGRTGWRAAGWRWLVGLLYAAGPVGLVVAAASAAMAVRRADHRSLHDWVAGTIIVNRWDRSERWDHDGAPRV